MSAIDRAQVGQPQDEPATRADSTAQRRDSLPRSAQRCPSPAIAAKCVWLRSHGFLEGSFRLLVPVERLQRDGALVVCFGEGRHRTAGRFIKDVEGGRRLAGIEPLDGRAQLSLRRPWTGCASRCARAHPRRRRPRWVLRDVPAGRPATAQFSADPVRARQSAAKRVTRLSDAGESRCPRRSGGQLARSRASTVGQIAGAQTGLNGHQERRFVRG